MPATTMTRLAIAALLALGSGAAGADSLISVQPDEANSQDVFVYKFGIGGFFGIPTPARSTNLDTATLNQITPPPVPFGSFLGTAQTVPFTDTPGGPLREHDTRTLIRFDLGSLALQPGQVSNARLSLFALPGLPPFENPSAANPVTTDLYRVTSSWTEQGVTWDNQPTVAATPAASAVQSGVNTMVSWDVTDLVRSWLADPMGNLGIELRQRDIVAIPQPGGARDRFVGSLYASSASMDPSMRPLLALSVALPVPEPASISMLAAGLVLIGAAARRKAQGR